MDETRRQVGLRAYASQFQLPPETVADHLSAMLGPNMAEDCLQATGAAWSPGSLAWRERSLVVITCLATLGGAEDRLASHLRWGLRNGLTVTEIDEALRVLAAYAGYPRATVAREVFERVRAAAADPANSESALGKGGGDDTTADR